MHASVNLEICIGCTLCTQICSAAFHMKGDKAVASVKTVSQQAHECARQAAEECPVQAITLSP